MFKNLLLILFPFFLFSQSNFDKGEKLYAENKLEAAREIFEQEEVKSKNFYKAMEHLGDIACKKEDWDSAIEYFETLKNKFPQNAEYQYKYGGALGMKAKASNKFVALGMIDDVEHAFVKATELDTTHIDSRWALVLFYVEIPAIIGGSEKKAQKYANQLMNLSKVDGYLAKGYIDVYFKRYQSAEKNYSLAHKIGNSKTTFEKLYDLYLNKLKNNEKAKKLKEEFNS